MNRARGIVAGLALAAAAFGAPDAGFVLTPHGGEGPWKPLLDALAAKGAIEAKFTERRFFTFRREPTVLKGVIRVSPEKGLSLQYVEPEATMVIVDAAGLIIRDRNGREHEMAAGSRAAGAIAALLPVMRFDLDALAPSFDIRATRDVAGWRIEFTPRDPDAARALGSIAVSGSLTDVAHLEFRRSATQRIEIDVGETRSGVVFTPDELSRYFRRAPSS